MIALRGIFGAAAEVQQILKQEHWQFLFHWRSRGPTLGNPRMTQDVDLTLITGFGKEEHYIDLLLNKLVPRLENTREFALKNRVLLARTQSGIDVDIALGGLPFEERTIQRASDWKTGDMTPQT